MFKWIRNLVSGPTASDRLSALDATASHFDDTSDYNKQAPEMWPFAPLPAALADNAGGPNMRFSTGGRYGWSPAASAGLDGLMAVGAGWMPGDPFKARQTPYEWIEKRDDLIKRVEAARRCKHTLGAGPVDGLVDYASAGQAITLAMAALDEGLPNGQKERVELALELLDMGVIELRRWCEAKGYKAFPF